MSDEPRQVKHCKTCGKRRAKSTGHTFWGGFSLCPQEAAESGITVRQWRAAAKREFNKSKFNTRPSHEAAPSYEGPIARTTAWNRANRAASAGRVPRNKRKVNFNYCRHCAKPKTKVYGHSIWRGLTYCPVQAGSEGYTWAEWFAEAQRNTIQFCD